MTKLKKTIIEKVVNILLNFFIGILSIILLITVYSGIQIKVLKQDYANFFGYTMFEVQTNSMADTIHAGDWIIVKLDSKVKLDDIITFKSGKDYITHRVVEMHQDSLVTRGDDNNKKDEAISYDQVIGKVTKTLKGFGIFKKTIFNSGVLIILIICLFLIESIIKDKDENEKVNKMREKVIALINQIKVKIKKQDVYLEKSPEPDNREELLIVEPIKEESEIIEVKTEDIEQEELIVDDTELIVEEEESVVSDVEDDLLEEPIDNQIEEELEEEFENYDKQVDELEKTQFFRIIPVDANELDDTLLEIAKYQMDEPSDKPVTKVEVDLPEVEEEVDSDELTSVSLDLLKNYNRRNKNTIDALMNIKTDELNEVIDLILDEEKLQTNEPTIKNTFVTSYIHARYYNYYEQKELNRGRNFILKFKRLLKFKSDELKAKYKGSDKKYAEKVDKFVLIFNILANIDQAKATITDLKSKREFYRSEISKYQKDLDAGSVLMLTNSIIKVQKTYGQVIKLFFEKLESNTFYLDLQSIRKNLFSVELKHNVEFSKIYSDYIIDKTYDEGIIAEDKMLVKLTLLLSVVLNDMIESEFEKKYFMMLPDTIYGKEKKIQRVLKMFEDEYAKSHITILIDFKTLTSNKRIVSKLRRAGFKFAIGFYDSKRLLAKDRKSLYVADTIFVNKKDPLYKNIEEYIPKDLKDIIIYDDVYSKLNNLEGE